MILFEKMLFFSCNNFICEKYAYSLTNTHSVSKKTESYINFFNEANNMILKTTFNSVNLFVHCKIKNFLEGFYKIFSVLFKKLFAKVECLSKLLCIIVSGL